ncbi:uncharacterized protein F4822DRAFT_393604 [Hypoxylon trugodes]|uniref:uncharacterized protein n=1 Tax=Hypoxylon trugodes TaxID=326681 RepID=UPI00219820C8|nr:uncharacterized protein F4822DRAFT_393604 [Hypoxylon trugodes]KAI1390571.1 hypothetical protein F4822DRAFT_393604 [Hypoxylon trugodes]
MDLVDLLPHSDAELFLSIPWKDRWECFRSVIIQLYLGKHGPEGKPMTMNQVAEHMLNHFRFRATVSQYRAKFRKWNIRRRILTSEKLEIGNALARRSHPEASTSNVTLGRGESEKEVDTKQLKRYMGDQIRHYRIETIAPGVLSEWNLPYAAFVASLARQPDQPSPFGPASATPDYVNIHSPEATTPTRQPDGPSPNMELVNKKAVLDQSSLFLQGRFKDLLIRCEREDRIMLINYFHEFYVHSFTVAKYWGRGPRVWTADMVASLTTDAASPPTPGSLMSVGSAPSPSHNRPTKVRVPITICRWSIHVGDVDYEPIEEPDLVRQDAFDIHDTSSWPQWPERDLPKHPFPETIQNSIANSSFTATTPENLPVSAQLIGKSLQENPSMVLVDAWKFAIMAGNVDLLISLSNRSEQIPSDIDGIYPMHLAAAFMDGGHHCCGVINRLCCALGGDYIYFHNVNNLGHTVLDALMISIIRSHTGISPERVSPDFSPPNRYPGEEKDICGRWDADSPAVRELFQRGIPRIPMSWKHPFCHTAAQAICHSTIAIFGSPASPDINTRSGLFIRRCGNCGLELKLGPLHTLIVVAFNLANQGRPGETLFGALAVLVCLLRLGADATLSVQSSAEDILGQVQHGICHHEPLNAHELMLKVKEDYVQRWSPECQIGWRCILQTLRLAMKGRIQRENGEPGKDSQRDSESEENSEEDSERDSEETSEAGYSEGDYCFLDDDLHGEWLRLPCGNPELGQLWATIQVELLTYRRTSVEKPWISENFLMNVLEAWLGGRSVKFHTPLVEKPMMRNYTLCGWFRSSDFVCSIAEEVCEEHIMNMDNYGGMASFIERPNFVESWGEVMMPETQ